MSDLTPQDRWFNPALALVLAATALAVWLLWGWLHAPPPFTVPLRIPQAHERPEPAASTVAAPYEGQLRSGPGRPAELAGAWPRFRGANFDNIAPADNLRARWLVDDPPPPRELWRVSLGEGHAAPVVRDGAVYVLDYDRPAQQDVLRCLSLADGREIWAYGYPAEIKRNHGISRTVSAVSDDYVVGLGPLCHVVCLDRRSGELLWGLDMTQRYATVVPPWYAGQCPLIDDDRVILAPGGSALMTALDIATGATIWETPNLDGWQMTHSSIMPMEYGGHKMYLYCADRGVVAVDSETGAVLWRYDDWRIRIANIPSPVVIGDDRIFLSGGYGAGSLMLRVSVSGDEWSVEPLFQLGPEVFGAAQQTPILYEGHLYGVRADEQMVCLALDGTVRWTSGRQHRFGLGPYIIADGLLFALADNGVLTVAPAQPDRFAPVGSWTILEGHDAWGPLAFVDGRLLARDMTTLVCLDIGPL